MPGKLTVCPTPIGNLDDVTPRVREALVGADYVACEDTRRTGGAARPARDPAGAAAWSPTTRATRPRGRPSWRSGSSAARGSRWSATPACRRSPTPASASSAPASIATSRSRSCPGPSVVPVALVASGLPTDRWRFEGFLPKRAGEMERVLRSTETVIAFESPRRLQRVARGARRDRRRTGRRRSAASSRSCTRRSRAGRWPSWRAASASDVKGEIVLVIGPAQAEEHGEDISFAVDALRHLVQSGARPRAAASVVAALTGTRANDLYRALTGREPRR